MAEHSSRAPVCHGQAFPAACCGDLQLAGVMRPGVILSMSFDYGVEGTDNPILDDPEVIERLAEPSGMELPGNGRFHTGAHLPVIPLGNMKRNIGSLFLKKPGGLRLPVRDECLVEPFPCLGGHAKDV